MIRALSLLGSGAFILAIAFLVFDAERFVVASVVLLLLSIPIAIFLGLRRGYHQARQIAGMAKAFVTGDVQHARLADVGEPRGLLFPKSNLVLELEGEDGAIHRFDRDVPVPLPMALSYRLGKRFKAPWIGNPDLTSMMEFELRREGLNIDLDWRPDSDREIVDGPTQTA